MSGHVRFLALALSLAGGAACSHQPKPAKAMSVTTIRPPTLAMPRKTDGADSESVPTSFAEASNNGDGSSIYFDFDSAQLRNDSSPVLQTVASSLRNQQAQTIRIEGNCDQLGTVEYNMALGQQRTEAAKNYLVRLGIPRERIATISYGSQRPKYRGLDEVDRQKNRRDDFVVSR